MLRVLAWVVPLATVLSLALVGPSKMVKQQIGAWSQLGDVAAYDPSPNVRTQAMSMLGDIGDRASKNALVRGLRDTDASVRAVAARLLGDVGGSAEFAALEAAKNDPSPMVRQQAAASLENITAPPARRRTTKRRAIPVAQRNH